MKKKSNKKKILIIGGTGFLGFNLAKKCLEKKWSVTSVSLKSKINKKRLLKKVNYIKLDISKYNQLKKKLSNYNYVVNFGGYVDHKKKNKNLAYHFKGCKNLVKFFEKKKIDFFIQIGTGLEYGKKNSPIKESSKCNPISIYAKSKYLASKYIIQKAKRNNFPALVLRPFQVYGPMQDNNRLIPIIINSCLKKEKFNCSDGKQFRDFIFIDDFIEAILKIISKSNKGQAAKVFNIGYGKPYKVRNIIKMIVKLCKGGQPNYGKILLRRDENKVIYPDILKIKKFINWHPKTNLETGLKKTIKLYKSDFK